MLRSQQASAPAHNSLKRVNEEPPTADAQHSLFWPSSDTSDAGASHPSFKTPSASSSFDLDSTPKTVSQLFLDNFQAHSAADLLQLGLPSLDPDLSTPSAPPSATTPSGLDTSTFAPSNSGCESSPAMSAGSNYNFETPSLHQVSALAAPLATSSPAVGSVGTAEAYSAKTSPLQHEQAWNHQSSYDKRSGLESPEEATPTFQAPYAHKHAAAGSAQQAHQSHQAQYNDHDYQGNSAHPGVSQYFQHRASISGPLMDSAGYAERYESSAAGPAPPRVHGLAAWENAAGSARPHTADGMFGQFGVVGAGATSHESSAESSVIGNSAGSNSRPYTPGSHAANVDAYYAHRRMSMPDPSSGSGGGKVFSYVAGDDGSMMSSSGMGMPSHSYGGHYFGGGYNAGASKKRPRRRYDEIERLYPCSWPGCTKSYGTLNHLNAHVAMQKHGPKRSPSEFKDMRKAWRKQKKEEEQRRQSRQVSMSEQALRPSYGSSAGYADMSSSELSGNASVLPIGPPPALSGFGAGQHAAGNLPGVGQLPGSMAHLSRYSMSSVSANPNATQPFYLNNTSADSTSTLGQHHHDHSHNATPLQYTGDSSRLPYPSSANNNAHYSNLGAYLSAHRGSV
ncbi:related to putative C2H2 transcriptional regulator [Ustilago trichophora]|uniref:Related to putative C2H2 transcriptional regulator n=1 Tax=Ustilago trichophora TaxID=86804 RepID=A0A5C3E8X5_9BASI|nr:related to putative C2H2 transcriptional regulator [Ustilago trichophora]